MNPESENFESLRRLLALKRHEQPPPGYYDNFSRQVVARLRTGERQTFSETFSDEPWVQRLLAMFTGKPAFAGAFGAAVCALLVSGIVYSEKMEVASTPSPVMASADGSGMISPSVMMESQPALGGSAMLVSSTSTNPVAFPSGSLFDQIPLPSIETVSYSR
jgi:hypothetical protein